MLAESVCQFLPLKDKRRMEGFPGERSVEEEIDFRILEPFSSARLVGNPQRAGKGTTLSLISFLGSTDQTTNKEKD